MKHLLLVLYFAFLVCVQGEKPKNDLSFNPPYKPSPQIKLLPENSMHVEYGYWQKETQMKWNAVVDSIKGRDRTFMNHLLKPQIKLDLPQQMLLRDFIAHDRSLPQEKRPLHAIWGDLRQRYKERDYDMEHVDKIFKEVKPYITPNGNALYVKGGRIR